MKFRRALGAFALLFGLLGATIAFAADVVVPPTPDHFVTDNAGALSSATRGELENELQAYERATGHQVIVWIGQSTGDVPLETWTGETADKWKIGRKGHDDGAVLFLFMADRKIRIEVGYGLESALPDADAYRIIQDVIRPKMRAGDTDGAVSAGVAAMLKTITPAYAAVTAPPEESGSSVPNGQAALYLAIALIFLGFGLFVWIMQVVRGIRYGYLVLREGSAAANQDMKRSHFWSGGFVSGVATGGSMFGGGGGGGFSAGGGGFGGGGASGGW